MKHEACIHLKFENISRSSSISDLLFHETSVNQLRQLKINKFSLNKQILKDGFIIPFSTTWLNFNLFKFIIIIIFYFENVAFFHTKIGSDVCPRVDNQTSGDTLQDSTQPLRVEKSPSASYPRMGIGARDFGGGMPFHTNQFGLWKRHWNLETSSVVVQFPPPHHQIISLNPTPLIRRSYFNKPNPSSCQIWFRVHLT